jgi:hypothetical protein
MKVFAAAALAISITTASSASERDLCEAFAGYIERDIAGWQEVAKTMRAYEVTAKLAPKAVDKPLDLTGMSATVSAITQSLVPISKRRSDDAIETMHKLRDICASQ